MLMAMFVAVGVLALFLKLIFRLLLLPLLLVKWLVMGVVMLVVGPIVFLVGLAAFLVFGLVLSVPLLPLVVVAALIWMLVRPDKRPVAA